MGVTGHLFHIQLPAPVKYSIFQSPGIRYGYFLFQVRVIRFDIPAHQKYQIMEIPSSVSIQIAIQMVHTDFQCIGVYIIQIRIQLFLTQAI